jgi:putative tributyrin esterase
MPLIHCNFFSEVLKLSTSMDVILPLAKWGSPPPTSGGHQTLYLLHGLSDDQTIWQRRTSIERYVEGLDLTVVMPAVQRSFYTDMAAGLPYWTFISQELPYVARTLFGLSAQRQDNFVAGLSMGGYGAFKLALSLPGSFSAAASLSGAVDIVALLRQEDPPWNKETRTIFGDPEQVTGSANDLFALARGLAKSKQSLPRLYQWCGTEDFLIKGNRRFAKQVQKLGLDLAYEESPGTHEWKYWDERIQAVITWLNPKKL